MKNNLTVETLHDFLKQVDNMFPVPLSKKIDLLEFAQKLHSHATICTYKENGRVLAMVAGYIDNTPNDFAYVTIAVVLEEARGRGLSGQLMSEFVDIAKNKGLIGVTLYAVRDNIPAVKTYQKLGFVELYLENETRPEDIHFVYYIKKRTALVTAIGSFSADIVIKNMKKQGYRVIGSDIYDERWVADSLNVESFYQVPKVFDKEGFLRAIDDICMSEKVTHILPSTDVEVDFFNEYRSYFEEKNIVICVSPTKTLEICRNKKKQQEFIDSNVDCIVTIPTIKMTEGMEVPFDYPMVCKPYDGRSSQGLKYINNFEDWTAVQNNIDKEKYIVQPMIRGQIVTVDVVRDKYDQAVAIPRVELLRTLNGAGTSVKVFHDEELEENCVKLANALSIVGCVNFEFLLDDNNKYHYIECNPRFSGGVEFSCMAGYDCVKNHVGSFEGKNIETFSFFGEMYIARKFEEYITSSDLS